MKSSNTSSSDSGQRACLGVRTNLLYDAASMVNLGIDCSIGTRWSLSAEVITPWWSSDDHSRVIKMFNGGVEARYYWKADGGEVPVMTGPYVGLHANAGVFDLAWQNRGVRGTSFVMGGAVIGYGFRIDDWWRMNLALGLGCLHSQYKHYHVMDEGENLYLHKAGNYTSFAPTKLELNIVWLFSQCWQK